MNPTQRLNFRQRLGPYLADKPAFPWLATLWLLPFFGVRLPWVVFWVFLAITVSAWLVSKVWDAVTMRRFNAKDWAADLWIHAFPVPAILWCVWLRPDARFNLSAFMLALAWLAGFVVIRALKLTDERYSYGSLDSAIGHAYEAREYLKSGNSFCGTYEQLLIHGMARSLLMYAGEREPGVR